MTQGQETLRKEDVSYVDREVTLSSIVLTEEEVAVEAADLHTEVNTQREEEAEEIEAEATHHQGARIEREEEVAAAEVLAQEEVKVVTEGMEIKTMTTAIKDARPVSKIESPNKININLKFHSQLMKAL